MFPQEDTVENRQKRSGAHEEMREDPRRRGEDGGARERREK